VARGQRAFSLDAHITPHDIAVIVDTHPKLGGMVKTLVEKHGLPQDQANGFIRKMVAVVLDDFGETYLGEMSTRLARIANLRDRIVTVYDSVLAGKGLPEGMTPAALKDVFAKLDTEMDGLKSPTLFAKEEGMIHADLAEDSFTLLNSDLAGRVKAPQVTGRLSFDDAIAGQTKAFGDLPPAQRAAVARAADAVPDVVRRAVESETEPDRRASIEQLRDELRRQDFDGPTIDAAADAVTALNDAHRTEKRRARVVARGEYDPATPEGRRRIEAIDRFYQNVADPEFAKRVSDEYPGLRKVLEHPVESRVFQDPDLRKALESNSALARLAHESPTMLMEMWVSYSKHKKGNFGKYIFDRRTRSHVVGLAGEFHATFQLGGSHVLLKSPDYDVTIPGTDMVALTRADGTIWLIDNKAFQQEVLGTVPALVENILPALERDLRDFTASGTAIQGPKDPVRGAVSDQAITDAVGRLSAATADVRTYLANIPAKRIGTPKVQKEIARRLAKYNIKRVVTNAGGEISGLSAALAKLGIEFHDLNK
jgi:hypothetical protein